ncbi:hypothetical protein D3C80_2232870 [compost metagenome]
MFGPLRRLSRQDRRAADGLGERAGEWRVVSVGVRHQDMADDAALNGAKQS